MTKRAWSFVALIVAALAYQVHAQNTIGATLIQQAAARMDAATTVSTSATSAATITLTPSAGECVYVHEVDIANCAGASAVTAAAVTTITTTNLNGTPAFTLGSGVAAGLCQPAPNPIYPMGLKAQTAGTNVTFVLPTFATNQTIRVNVAWRSASC